MESMTATRPSYSLATKAGWIAIYSGILVGFLAAIAFLIVLLGGAGIDWSATGIPWPMATTLSMAIIQALIGVVAIVAGAGMLKRQSWSRSVLEGLCWTTAFEILLVIIGWKRLMVAMGWSLPGIFLIAVIALPALTYVLAAVLAIRALRSPAMYDELEQTGP